MLVTAVAIFFSTFSTPILSAVMTFGLYVAGHFNADLKNFEKVVSSKAAAQLARAAYHVLPDLSAFDVKTQVVHGLPVAPGYLVTTAAYGLMYVWADHAVDRTILGWEMPVTWVGTERVALQGHTSVQVVESMAPAEQLAQDKRVPSLGDDLGRLGDRAELTVPLHPVPTVAN